MPTANAEGATTGVGKHGKGPDEAASLGTFGFGARPPSAGSPSACPAVAKTRRARPFVGAVGMPRKVAKNRVCRTRGSWARSAICRRRRPSRPRRRAIYQRRARAGARRCRRGKSSASRASPRGRRRAAAARTDAARARGRLSFRGMPTVNADGLRRIPRGSVGDSSTKCVVRSVGVRRRHAPRYFCKKYPRSTNGVARAAR